MELIRKESVNLEVELFFKNLLALTIYQCGVGQIVQIIFGRICIFAAPAM
jgi:hypothetical protein